MASYDSVQNEGKVEGDVDMAVKEGTNDVGAGGLADIGGGSRSGVSISPTDQLISFPRQSRYCFQNQHRRCKLAFAGNSCADFLQ